MKKLIKKNLTNIILIAIIIFGGRYFINEAKIGRTNTNNFITSAAKEILLTKHQMKKALNENTQSIMDSIGDIKARNVHTYTQTVYHYHDSTITTTQTRYDSLRDNYSFMFDKGCWTIGGYINPKQNLITLDKRILNDTIDLFHYRAFDHKFWFIKWGKYNVAGAYSRCKGDTLKVVKFYKRR